jgi:hypothetical protein
MQAKGHACGESANVFNKVIRGEANLAKPIQETKPVRQRKFAMRDLCRTALWGLAAAGAMSIAVYAATTEIGQSRLRLAVAEIHEVLMPSGIKPIHPLDAREGRRLAETVRTLAADRERLLDRVATLEQSIDGITGSIARVERAAKATSPDLASAPAEAAPPPSPPEDDLTASINPPAPAASPTPNPVPMPPSPPGSNAAKTEFGLDLGSATTVEALRTAWTAALRRHGTLLEGLRPVVQARERPRPGATELRLIAGPIPNAAAAARLCAAMTAAGAICAPTVFDGQRLAGR